MFELEYSVSEVSLPLALPLSSSLYTTFSPTNFEIFGSLFKFEKTFLPNSFIQIIVSDFDFCKLPLLIKELQVPSIDIA